MSDPTPKNRIAAFFGKAGSNAVFFAILAAVLYGISAPFSKMLLSELHPTLLAGLLYLGAGLGMLGWNGIRKAARGESKEARLTSKDLPYVVAMILLDVAAPIALMTGLSMTTAANASLLNNFEIVATGLLASLFFKESIGRRTGVAILLITTACLILSFQDASSFSFSAGSLLVLLACLCWGLENNCTRMISLKNPLQIVVIKGFGAGLTAIGIYLAMGGALFLDKMLVYALLLGFVAYGLSIYFYILAQRHLGAARTSAYYAAAPFIGVIVSWIVLGEPITGIFTLALVVMLLGTYLAITEKHQHRHIHEPVTHTHRHNHQDGHHLHSETEGEHTHPHTHEAITHSHGHTPDMHHAHTHTKDHSHGKDQNRG